MASGAQIGNVISLSLDKASWLSSRLLGVDVAGAQDGTWSYLRFAFLYFDAKPSPDRCRPVPSCWIGRCHVRMPFRGVRSPRGGIHDMVLTTRVHDAPNLMWRSLPLQGHAYLMLELSW
jgi:hypothetical protein